MPTAEIIPITRARRAHASDPASSPPSTIGRATEPMGSEAVAMLREIARSAAEVGADPSAPPIPDGELLSLCDQIVTCKRHVQQLWEAYRQEPRGTREINEFWRQQIHDAELAGRPLLVRAGKIRAAGPAGIYAKAMAVRHAGAQAGGLAKSLANDLLACAALRGILCPVTPGNAS